MAKTALVGEKVSCPSAELWARSRCFDFCFSQCLANSRELRDNEQTNA